MRKSANIKTSGDLAEAIIDDIRGRGLRIGDRYLTAKEIGELFSVSTVTAHRAMVALSDDNVVIRKRKSGTFIGPGFIRDPDMDTDAIHVLHVIMDKVYSKNYPQVYNIFNDVSDKVFGDCMVEFHIVPERESHQAAKRLISQIESSEYNEAVILIRSSERMQKMFEESEVKTVIFGSSFPGVGLPSLDADQMKSGAIITQSLINKNCKQFLLIMHNSWRQGDNVLFNSISQTLGESNYPMGSLIINNIPVGSAISGEDLISELEQRSGKTGIITRSHLHADEIEKILNDKDLDISIGCCDNSQSSKVSYDYIIPKLNYRQQVKKVLNILIEEENLEKTIDVSLKLN